MSGYHLCSDNYKKTIFQGFSTLQLQEEFVDLTLAAEGYLVKVHKNIIAVASPYIKALLKSAPCSSPVIFLNNVRQVILQFIITYIYEGEVDVPEYLIEEFVQVGKALHLNGINSIPKKTALVLPKTAIVNKPVSSKNVAAHIRINSINDKHSLEVLQLSQNEPSMPSSASIIEQIPSNVNQIHNGNEIHSEFQSSKNFVIPNNQQTGNNTGIGNDIVTVIDVPNGNDIGTGNDIVTVGDPPNENDIGTRIDFAIGYEFGTGNEIATVINPPTADDGNTNNFAICNNFETGNDIVSVHNPLTGNDCHTGTEEKPENDTNYSTEPIFNYSLQVQSLDLNVDTTKPDSDVNTELDKIDPNDLKGMSQYSVTERGAIQLILNRFIYCCQFESRRGHRRRWRCIDYRRSHCPAFVETEDGLIVKRKGLHNHRFHDNKVYDKHKKGLIFTSEDTVKEYLNKIHSVKK